MTIRPINAKAAGSWAVVQRWHKHLQCGNIVYLKLQLLQSILVPSVHYGCEVYGMYSPRLQRSTRHALIWNYAQLSLRICRIRLNPPSAKLLTELGLSPLKVFCWRWTLNFDNKIAASPPKSLHHTILLDNQHDTFQGKVRNFSSSVSEGLAAVGYHMSRDTNVISMLDVPAIVDLLQQDSQGNDGSGLHCPMAAPFAGVSTCTYHQWFQPYSKRLRHCLLPVSGRRMRPFLHFMLGSRLPSIVIGRFSGGHHVPRADRTCLRPGSV